MESKRVSFGYEDTDQKIEVELYGLVFEINKEVIVNKDIKMLDEDDETKIENEIEEILGKGSIEKINNKRIVDGYNKMTLDVEIAVLTCIYKAYITATTGNMIDEINDVNIEMENRAKNLSNGVKVRQRRRYNKNKYKRNYKRY